MLPLAQLTSRGEANAAPSLFLAAQKGSALQRETGTHPACDDGYSQRDWDFRSFIPDASTGYPRCGRCRQESGLSRNTARMPHTEGPLWIGDRTVSDGSERPILTQCRLFAARLATWTGSATRSGCCAASVVRRSASKPQWDAGTRHGTGRVSVAAVSSQQHRSSIRARSRSLPWI